MADLPEPDWVALSESASRAMRAFDSESPVVETALVAAFHDGAIRTRGRCRTWFRYDWLYDLAESIWDRADVDWQGNGFTIPSEAPGRRIHIFSDVSVHREGLEEWINPDGTVSEEPPPDPEPPEETQAKEPPEDPPLQRAVNKSEPPASSEPPRQQQARTATTAERNADIQQLAESIWLDAWKEKESQLLTKNEVADRMLDDKTFESRFRNHKAREGGALAQETIVRLISEPKWVRKERSRRKVIKTKNIPSC